MGEGRSYADLRSVKGAVSLGETGVLSVRKGQGEDLHFQVRADSGAAEQLSRDIAEKVEGATTAHAGRDEASGLTGVKISLPAAVSPGDTATLVCHYDLEGEPLYTIKWYKGREEFYRYVPKEHPETQVFPLPGIDVDVGMSGDGRVVLREVSSELTGKYRCEVSADAPNFHTKVVSAHMRVVKKLEGDPMLVLEKTRYTVGDMLRGNCTSPAHIPSANLTVFINGRKVNTSFLERKSDNYKRIRTTVGINYLVLTAGGLRIQCVADLYNAFTTQTELVLEEDRPRLASVLGTRDSGSVGSKTLSNFSCIIFLLINVLMVYLR